MDDLISRQALMKEFSDFVRASNSSDCAQTPTWNDAVSLVGSMPSAQQEPLTDKEQRIFLAAMAREMKICEEIDRNYVNEPYEESLYEDSLMKVCNEIKRKVKDALWTI